MRKKLSNLFGASSNNSYPIPYLVRLFSYVSAVILTTAGIGYYLVFAANTTIGNNISTSGTLTVGSTSLFSGSINASSTLQVTGTTTLYGILVSSSTATSTFANGIQLSGGCFRDITGTCITSSGGGGGSGTVNSGTQGQIAFYDSTGTAISGTSTIFVSTTTLNVGIGTTTPGTKFSVHGNVQISGDANVANLNATGTLTANNLSVTSSTTLQNFTANNSTTTQATTTYLAVSGTASATQIIVSQNSFFGGLSNFISGMISSASSTFSNILNVTGLANFSSLATFSNGFVSTASSTISNSLNVSGGLSASSTLSVGGGTALGSTLSVTGTSTLAGLSAGFGTFSGNLIASGRLDVSGQTTLSNASTTGMITTAGGFISSASSTVAGTLQISGAVFASSTISADRLAVGTGTSTFAGGLETGTLGVTGTSSISGLSAGFGIFSGNLLASGNFNVSGTSTLAGVSAGFGTFSSNLVTSKDLSVSGLANLSGFISSASSTISANLQVSGAIQSSTTISTPTLSATEATSTYLAVTGSASTSQLIVSNNSFFGNIANFINGLISSASSTFSSILNVTGLANFSSLATFSNGFLSTASSTVNANLNVAGPLSASSTLTVAGNSILSGFVSNASSTVSSLFNVSGPLNASSTLLVANLSSLYGGFISNASSTIANNLTVTGQINASSTITVTGTSGTSTIGSITIGPNGNVLIGTTTSSSLVSNLVGGAAGFEIATRTIAFNSGADGSLGVWATSSNNLPALIALHTVVSANGYIYAISGQQSGANRTTIFYSKINSDGTVGPWGTTTTAMPSVTNQQMAVVNNGYIYFAGSTNVISSRLSSDGSISSWNSSTNFYPSGYTALVGNAAVVSNGYLYLLQGRPSTISTSTVIYAKLNSDGTVGSWNSVFGAFATSTRWGASVAANGYIYYLGGDSGGATHVNATSSVYYAKVNSDGSLGAFQTNTNYLPSPREGLSAVVANGYIYAMGGADSSFATSSSVYFAKLNSDGSTGVWQTANSMPGARDTGLPTSPAMGGTLATVVNGYIYVVGGTFGAGGTTGASNAVFYASLPRTLISGNLDLLGLASTTLGSFDGDNGSVGGSIFAGNIFAQNRLEVAGNTQLWGGLGVNGIFSLTASTSVLQTASIFSIQTATATSPALTVLYNGNVGIGTSSPTTPLSVVGNISNTASSLTQVGSTTVGTDPQSVFVSGRYAYVASYGDGVLRVFDVSTSSPALVGSTPNGSVNSFHSVYVSGRYAYVADYINSVLRIYDVSTSTPAQVGSIGTGGNAYYVSVSGRYAYVINYAGGLKVIDVANPAGPVIVGSASTDANASGLYVSGYYAYVITTNSTLQIFDVSNPKLPGLAKSTAVETNPSGIYVSGRYAYIVNNSQPNTKLQIFDISTSTPSQVGAARIGTGSTAANSVFVSGRYAYVTSFYYTDTLQVFDISNPVSPIFVGSGTGDAGFTNVFVSGRYAYVTSDQTVPGTLQIFDVGGLETPSAMIHSLEAGNLQVRNDIIAQGQLQVGGGLTVGTGGILSSGPIAVSLASSTITNSVSAYFGGYVGVGTSSPFWNFQVANTRPSIALSDASAGINLKHWTLSSQGGNFYLASALDSYATNSPALSILSGGNFGIGTTTPGSLLAVQGNALFSGNLSSANIIATGTISVTGTSGTSTIGSITIGPNGNVLIGTTTSSSLVSNLIGGTAGFEIATRTIAFNSGADGTLGAWATTSGLPVPVIGHDVVAANGYIYSLGGQQGGQTGTARSTIFYSKVNSDGSLGTWASTTGVLTAALGQRSAEAYNGYIYYNAANTETSAKINSDGSLSNFVILNNYPPGYTSFTKNGGVVSNGYLYHIGGRPSNTLATSSIIYAKLNSDGTTGSWTQQTNMLATSTNSGAAVSANGYVYYIGGDHSGTLTNAATSTIYYAKVNADGSLASFVTSPNYLPAAREGLTANVANGYIYAMGGQDSTGATSTAVYFTKLYSDGSIGVWQTANPLPTGRSSVVGTNSSGGNFSAIINGYVYVVGGGNNGYTSTVFYSSLPRVLISGNLDLLGLASTTLGDWSSGDSGSIGGSIFAGSIFSAGQLTVTGSSQLYGGLGVSGMFSLTASSSAPQNKSIFSIQAATSSGPFLSVLYNGTVAVGSNEGGLLIGTTSPGAGVVMNGQLTIIASTSAAHPAALSVQADGSIGPWASTSMLIVARSAFASVVANGFIYVFNGADVNGVYTTSAEYARINSDGSLGAWATTTRLANNDNNFNAVTYNGYIYTSDIGTGGAGINSVGYAKVNSDGTLGAWKAGNNPQFPGGSATNYRSYEQFVVARGYLYELGGADSSNVSTSTVLYTKLNIDGSFGPWASTTALIPPPFGYGTDYLSANGYIYQVGGYNTSGMVNYAKVNYDGTLGNWQAANSLPVATGSVNTTVTANGYLVVWGLNGSTLYFAKLNSDGTVGAWQAEKTKSPNSYSAGNTVTANGYLYNIAGSDQSGARSNAVMYASFGRTQILGDLDLIGLASTTFSDFGSETSNMGGSLHAGNLFSQNRLEVGGMASIWSGLNVREMFSLSASSSIQQNYSIFNIQNATGTSPILNILYNGNIFTGTNLTTGGNLAVGTTSTTFTTNSQLTIFASTTAATPVAFSVQTNGSIGSWASTTSMINSSSGGPRSTVAVNGYVYAMGGVSLSSTEYAKVNSDGSLGTWTATTPLPANADGYPTVTANGYIYMNNPSNNSSILYSKINSNGSLGSWSAGTTYLGGTRVYNGVVTAGGYIYNLGGRDSGNISTSSVSYAKLNSDGSIGPWASTTALITVSTDTVEYRTKYLAANGYIYQIGRHQDGTVNYARINADGTLGNWSNTNSVPVGGANSQPFSSVVSNGYLYVYGLTTSSAIGDLYYAKLNSNGSLGVWNTQKTSVINKYNAQSMVVSNGYLYALGGLDNNGSGANDVTYASFARTQISGDLDLIGLSSTTVSDLGSNTSNIGSSLYAGNIFSQNRLEVGGNASIWGGLNVSGLFSLTASTSALQTASIFSIQNATGTLPLFSLNYNGGLGIGTTSPNSGVLIMNGNLGIGTSTPSQLLSIQGNGLFSGNLSLANLSATGSLFVTNNIYATGTINISSSTGTSTIGALTIGPNGNVLIGTTTSSALVSNMVGGAAGFEIATRTIAFNSGADGTLGAWATTSGLPVPDIAESVVAANGYIYALGGFQGGSAGAANRSTIFYSKVNSDGSLGTWASTTGVLTTALGQRSAVVNNGYIYFNAAATETSAKINSDGSLSNFIALNNYPPGYTSFTKNGGVVSNGYLYHIGGRPSNVQATSSVIYAKLNADGTTGSWIQQSNFLATSTSSGAAVSANGYVYYIGGDTSGSFSTAATSTVYYAKVNADGSLAPFVTSPNYLPAAREGLTANVANGYIYTMGGQDSTGATSTAVYFTKLNSDGTIGAWQTNPNPMPTGRSSVAGLNNSGGNFSAIINGYVYVVGGGNNGYVNTVFYSSLPRTMISGSLDLLGLASTTLGDWAGDNGSMGGSIFAGNIFSAGRLEVAGNSSLWGGLNVGGAFSLTASSSAPQNKSIFSIQNATTSTPFLSVLYNGNVGIGTSSPTFPFTVAATSSFAGNISNIADPGWLPIRVGSTTIPDAITGMAVSGRYLYAVGNSPNGFFSIFDISSTTPVQTGTTTYMDFNVFVNGANPIIAGRYAYVTALHDGLRVYDISTNTPALIGKNTTNGTHVSHSALSGKYVYTMADATFSVFDVSNPTAPLFLGSTQIHSASATDLVVSGNFAYVSSTGAGTDDLEKIDVSNPLAPQIVGSSGVGGSSGGPGTMVISGKYLFSYSTPDGGNKLQTFDISTSSPALVNTFTLDIGVANEGMAISGRYLFIASSGTLEIIDIGNPTAPVKVSKMAIGVGYSTSVVSGRYAYLGDSSARSIQVLDIGGLETTSAIIHSLQAGEVQVWDNLTVQGRVTANTALEVGPAGIFSQGPVSISNSTSSGSSYNLQLQSVRPMMALFDTSAGTNLKNWTLSSQGGNFYIATSSDALATSSVPSLMIDQNGNVGIGTTTPSGAKLSVQGSCVDTGAGCADYAELYPSSETVEPGDILMVNTGASNMVKKATQESRNLMIGAVSSNPAVLIEGSSLQFLSGHGYRHNPDKPAVALSGRIPVKVNLEGGEIAVGDQITISSVPGIGKKATDSGKVIGYALESFSASTTQNNGKVLVFASLENYQAASTSGSTGDTSLLGQVVDLVKSWLESMQVFVSDGLVRLHSLVSENLTATIANILNLKVGTAENPTGVTIYDKTTKEPYCLIMDNGQFQSIPGECGASAQQSSGNSTTTPPTATDTTAPIITLTGDNTITITRGDTWVDPGASVSDPADDTHPINNNLSIYYKVNGTDTGNGGRDLPQTVIDTNQLGTSTISYISTDSAGNTGTAERSLIVVEPSPAP